MKSVVLTRLGTTLLITALAAVTTAAPAFAQVERGYISGLGGFAVGPDGTSGDVSAEAGVRVLPHLLVFANVGQIKNLQPSELQPTLDAADATLATTEGLDVVGTARVPAWYSTGGVRFDVPVSGRVLPYVFGGVGFARLTPVARFTYTSGVLPTTAVDANGLPIPATAAPGDDVTNQVIALGTFTDMASTTDLLLSWGGGAEVPISRHLAADVGYRFSHVTADTPLHAQGMTFGLGYRF